MLSGRKDGRCDKMGLKNQITHRRYRSGNHLEANRFMIELLKAITPRLGDSQSNLKPLAASALAEVASSVGPEAATKVRLSVVMSGAGRSSYMSFPVSEVRFRIRRRPTCYICPILSLSSRYVQRIPHTTPHMPMVRVYYYCAHTLIVAVHVWTSSVGLLLRNGTQLTRIYGEPLLACVSDNRKMMRDAAIAALQKVTRSGGEGGSQPKGHVGVVWTTA